MRSCARYSRWISSPRWISLVCRSPEISGGSRSALKLPGGQLGNRALDPERRLVVGYVSSDFRSHSAALGFMPLLHYRDRCNFEIICYSSFPTGDEATETYRG